MKISFGHSSVSERIFGFARKNYKNIHIDLFSTHDSRTHSVKSLNYHIVCCIHDSGLGEVESVPRAKRTSV